VVVRAERGGTFRLANPWGSPAVLRRATAEETSGDAVLTVAMVPGEVLEIVPDGPPGQSPPAASATASSWQAYTPTRPWAKSPGGAERRP
jgi:hypothetical protein